jgi:membrane protein DedA with SNARE-associated domain
MRPTKEVLLAAGFLIRLDEVWWVPVIAAAAPLALLGVWHAYYLGRFYAPQIRQPKNLPWIVRKVLKPDRVKLMQGLLKRKGMKLVLLGRLAVFPSTLVGMAAGSGDVPSRKFFPADAIGGLLSIVEAVGLGFLLGEAYKRAGPWITVAGFVAVAAVAFIVARQLKKEKKRQRAQRSSKKKKPGGRSRKAAGATSRS